MGVQRSCDLDVQVCNYMLINTQQAVSQKIVMLIEMRTCYDDSQLDWTELL